MSYVKLWKALRNGELRGFRELLGDRALMVAALFSVALHAALFLFLGDWPEKPASRPPAVMVVRLLKPAVPAPLEVPEEVNDKKDGVDTEEEKLPDPGPDIPPDREGADAILPGDPGISASLAAGSGAAPVTATGRLHLESPAVTRAVTVPAHRVSRGGSAGRLDISPLIPAAGRDRDFRSAILEIRKRIEAKKRYPLLARRRGWEGDVLVEIVLGGAGELEVLRLLRHSGFPLLDRATLTAVRAAVPFPPVPGRVKIPVSYRLVPD